MASSVLGKRTRSSTDAGKGNSCILSDLSAKIEIVDPNSATLRAKRQATITIFNDDNESPFAPRQTRTNSRDVKSMELDELADIPAIKPTSAKHSGAGGRAALSPTKIKTDFNTVKTCNGRCPTERTRWRNTNLL